MRIMVLAAVVGLAGQAPAADQTVLGKSLTVKNPSTPDRRKVVVSGKEPGSTSTLVGDPTADGGALTVTANGGAPTSQTFALPQGVSASGKPSRTFTLKAVVQGKLDGGTVIVPPRPGDRRLRHFRDRPGGRLPRALRKRREHQEQRDQAIQGEEAAVPGCVWGRRRPPRPRTAHPAWPSTTGCSAS
jgi:hypothetical protein